MSENEKIIESYSALTDLVQRELNACQNELSQFQQITATTYEGVARNLPAIMSKIEEKNEDARALTQYFIPGDPGQAESETSGDNSGSVVSDTVREAKHNIVTASKRIQQMFKADQQVFEHLQKHVDQIEKLRQSIMEIIKISEDIELLSQNSVFVASKAWQSGAAFSNAASEIKALSRQTKGSAGRMRESSDNLVANYEKFSDEVESLNEKTNARLSNIDSELDTIFDKYNSGLTIMATLLSQTLERSDSAKGHVPAIMVSLQPQDLVKQLLDQISLINNDLSSINSRAPMDSYSLEADNTFTATIEEQTAKILAGSSLNKSILDKIADTLENSVEELSELLEKLNYELKDIESDRISMTTFSPSPQDSLDGKSSIERIFDESVSVIQDIFDFRETSILKKREVSRFGKMLEKDLQTIENLLEGMRHIVRQFATVKIVSGIEIAREDNLHKNMTAPSIMFEKLTENIDKHILLLKQNLETINADIIANLELLNENIAAQENSLPEINAMVNKSINKLQTIRFNINDAVKTVGTESKELFELIDISINGVKNIRQIVGESGKIGSYFDTIFDKANNIYQLGFKNNPSVFSKETNYLRFPELKGISNKFSIHSDNEENVDKHVDESSELSGDLVLF